MSETPRSRLIGSQQDREDLAVDEVEDVDDEEEPQHVARVGGRRGGPRAGAAGARCRHARAQIPRWARMRSAGGSRFGTKARPGDALVRLDVAARGLAAHVVGDARAARPRRGSPAPTSQRRTYSLSRACGIAALRASPARSCRGTSSATSRGCGSRRSPRSSPRSSRPSSYLVSTRIRPRLAAHSLPARNSAEVERLGARRRARRSERPRATISSLEMSSSCWPFGALVVGVSSGSGELLVLAQAVRQAVPAVDAVARLVAHPDRGGGRAGQVAAEHELDRAAAGTPRRSRRSGRAPRAGGWARRCASSRTRTRRAGSAPGPSAGCVPSDAVEGADTRSVTTSTRRPSFT